MVMVIIGKVLLAFLAACGVTLIDLFLCISIFDGYSKLMDVEQPADLYVAMIVSAIPMAIAIFILLLIILF